jgi:hypothetical protein
MTDMANGSSIDVEALLAEAVRTYLLAEPNDRISEDENLCSVCQCLSRLLQDLLRSADGWSEYAWVDGILPCTAIRESTDSLVLTGLLIWLGGTKSQEWKDPLLAAIRLSGNSPVRLTYELHFGDADRGLGKCPYGSQHDFPYVPVENWLFTFASPDSVR